MLKRWNAAFHGPLITMVSKSNPPKPSRHAVFMRYEGVSWGAEAKLGRKTAP